MPLAHSIAFASSSNALHRDRPGRRSRSGSSRRPARGRRRPSARGSSPAGRAALPPVTTSALLGPALEEALDALALALGVDRAQRRCRRSSVSPDLVALGLLGEAADDVVVDAFEPRARASRRCSPGRRCSSRSPAIVSIAGSMSASSKTITGALPPSSRWTRFSESAAALAIHLPVVGRAGQRDHVDVGVA